MEEIEVTFNCEVPSGMSEEQIQEWLEFSLGCRASMNAHNPGCSKSFESWNVNFAFN